MLKVLFVILVLLVLIGSGLDCIMMRHLKKRYNEAWIKLGAPTFLNHSISNDIKAIRFEWWNEYKQLNDKILNILVPLSKVLTVVYWILAGVFIFNWRKMGSGLDF